MPVLPLKNIVYPACAVSLKMESHLKRHLKNRPELTKQLSVQNFQQEDWELHLSTVWF